MWLRPSTFGSPTESRNCSAHQPRQQAKLHDSVSLREEPIIDQSLFQETLSSCITWWHLSAVGSESSSGARILERVFVYLHHYLSILVLIFGGALG